MADKSLLVESREGWRLPRQVWVAGWVSFFMDVSSEMVYPLVPLFLTSLLKGYRWQRLIFFGLFAVSFLTCTSSWRSAAHAATEEEIASYRRIWNPFSAGPQLVSSADLQPQGQFFLRPYVYSQIGYGRFGNTWSPVARSLPQQLSAINPQVEFSYGITNSLEFEMYVSEVSWWQSSGNSAASQSGHGLGDTTAFLKYRFNVQQDDSWWPTLTNAFYVSLPTSDWAGTPSVPGGFAPLGRLPSTHFGTPGFTESVLFRKNTRPFRISGGVFYSYGPPSSNNNLPQYFGDIFQYRLAFEHFLDDAKGFAYAIEVLGLHGLPFRLDGHAVNAKPESLGLVGVQPTVEYKFTDQIVGAAGVLFTLAGQNDIAAVYPNFSIYYYLEPNRESAGAVSLRVDGAEGERPAGDVSC